MLVVFLFIFQLIHFRLGRRSLPNLPKQELVAIGVETSEALKLNECNHVLEAGQNT